MAVNIRKVVSGGLLAGVVIIIINVLAQFALMDRAQREMNAWMPGSADRMSMGGGAIAAGIIMKFVIGIMLVWFYAAIRPRFGPGARTAFYVAVFVWILGGIFFSDFLIVGMMSSTTYAMLEFFQLLSLLIATWLGARIYSE